MTANTGSAKTFDRIFTLEDALKQDDINDQTLPRRIILTMLSKNHDELLSGMKKCDDMTIDSTFTMFEQFQVYLNVLSEFSETARERVLSVLAEIDPEKAIVMQAKINTEAPIAVPQPTTDILHDTIRTMDALSQDAFSQIYAIAKLALVRLETPEGCRNIEDIAGALKAIRAKAEEAEDCINGEAERVECGYVDTAYKRRMNALMGVNHG